MSAEDVNDQLRRLRVRVGNPSVRELERLTEQQGSRRRMSSSTIHDKLNGKSPLKLPQLLALVRACSDYARAHGISLSSDELDETLWRKRLEADPGAGLQEPSLPEADLAPLLKTPDLMSTQWKVTPTSWDLRPLRLAGMDDVVELIEGNVDKPMAGWLPSVIYAVASAGMSNEQFLQFASRQSASELVPLVQVMGDDLSSKILDRLLLRAATNQPATLIPALVVSFRRASSDVFNGRAVAQRIISHITGERTPWYVNPVRRDFSEVVHAFRDATLSHDVHLLLTGIGMHRPNIVIDVVTDLGGPDSVLAATLLTAVARGTERNFMSVIRELNQAEPPEDERRRFLTKIAYGIQHDKLDEIIGKLSDREFHYEARFIREISEAPPF